MPGDGAGERPGNSPDALVEKILNLNAEMPGCLPPELKEEAIRAEESGTPLYVNDEEMRVMAERLVQVRNQLTIGELLESISEEHLGNRRATLNELMRIADVGVELLCTVIAHRDITPEVLEEARGQWGPLVDIARQMCGLGPTVI
jgi:hypothetical protein